MPIPEPEPDPNPKFFPIPEPDPNLKKPTRLALVVMLMMMMIMMTMTMMVMMMMVNICLRTCKTPDNKKIDQQLHKKANPEKIPKNYQTIPGLKIEANPDPENPGIPGFLQNPVPKIPGLKLLIPLGPGYDPYFRQKKIG